MANKRICTVLTNQIRSFSSTPKVNSDAPLQLYGLEGRYAHAIYAAAKKQNKLDAVDKDFQNISNLFKTEKRLNDVLKNPLLTKEQRANAVNEIGTKKNANQLTVNTLSLLAENGRLGRLQGVAKSFAILMAAHKGQVHAKVTSAKPLDGSQLKELTAVLQTFIKQNHKLELETQVNPELVGGMVIELGDRYIDLSLATKLKTYSNIVKETL